MALTPVSFPQDSNTISFLSMEGGVATRKEKQEDFMLYLSHEIREEEHVGQESHPSKKVAHTQTAIVGWHA